MQIELPPRLRAAFQPSRAAPSNPTFPAGSCSLLYLNPPYDVEVGSHSNQRLELVFLDHCYGWLKTAGVLIFGHPEPCALALRQTSGQPIRADIRISPHSPGVGPLPATRCGGDSQERTPSGDTRYADQLLRLAYNSGQLPTLSSETTECYIVPESKAAVPIQYRGLPLDAIEDAINRSSAMQNALNLLVRKQERIEGRPVTPLHGGHVGLLCTAGMLNGVFGQADGCFRGPIGVANRRRPLRHLVGLSQEMVGNAKQDRLLLISEEPMFVWSSLLLYFGLPALPDWADWFLSELKRRKRIQALAGFGYRAVAVKTRRQELLKLIEQGLRQKKLSFPTSNGPVHWAAPGALARTS